MMAFNDKRTAVVFALLLVCTTVSLVFVNSEKEVQQTQTVAKNAYIIQGLAIDSMADLVENAGGEISHELPIINAVGAVLTESQYQLLASNSDLRLLENTEVTSHSNQSTLPDYATETHIVKQIGADKLHASGIKGQGITIATIDSGISAKNERGNYLRLDSNGGHRLIAKYNAIKGKRESNLNDDDNGHGSHVTGIAVSSVKDHTGRYNGVAPNALLISVKAFDKNGSGNYLDVIDGLNWIIKNKNRYNIRVVNLSFGAKVTSHYWDDPLNQAVMKAWDEGIVVVTSAGNQGPVDMTITSPGNNPYVITVGAATDSYTPDDYSDDRMTTFSSRGPTYEAFIKPEIVSWGGHNIGKINGDLIKDLEKKHKKNDKGHDYYQVAGTSQASAVVTGTVALMLNLEPWLEPDTIKCRLMATASAIRSSNGRNDYNPFEQGAGLMNAYDAVMSYADDCANRGLDIEDDLEGEEHFMGPARLDSNGNFSVPDLEANGWLESNGWLEANGWLESNTWLEANGWLESNNWLETNNWLEAGADLEGSVELQNTDKQD